jgi:hypothetical protein
MAGVSSARAGGGRRRWRICRRNHCRQGGGKLSSTAGILRLSAKGLCGAIVRPGSRDRATGASLLRHGPGGFSFL